MRYADMMLFPSAARHSSWTGLLFLVVMLPSSISAQVSIQPEIGLSLTPYSTHSPFYAQDDKEGMELYIGLRAGAKISDRWVLETNIGYMHMPSISHSKKNHTITHSFITSYELKLHNAAFGLQIMHDIKPWMRLGVGILHRRMVHVDFVHRLDEDEEWNDVNIIESELNALAPAAHLSLVHDRWQLNFRYTRFKQKGVTLSPEPLRSILLLDPPHFTATISYRLGEDKR